MDDARDWAAIDDERHRDAPARVANHKRAGAVDRIDDDETAALEALEIVGCLLGKPAGVGQRFPQAALQKRVRGEIGVRHRRSAGFGHDPGRSSAPDTKRFERQRSGFARGRDQKIARGTRVNIRVDAQSGNVQ